MKIIKKFCFYSLSLFVSAFLFATDLPDGYGGVKLGSSVETTKEQLKKNSDFGYNGDRDVSFLPGQNNTLIETDATRWGSTFLERCWFQFNENRLYTIIINVNQNKMDYYSIFSKLCEKYGDPESLTPQKAQWSNDDVTMTLEKPLTLKYVDNNIFNEIQDKSRVEKSVFEKTREMFLDDL